ncbi:hypothetical protein [Acinetobacter populi]|nr:hypothetical protein [Acinetobacter populi]
MSAKEINGKLYVVLQKALIEKTCIKKDMISSLNVKFQLELYEVFYDGSIFNLSLLNQPVNNYEVMKWFNSIRAKENVTLVCDGEDIGYDEGAISF